MPIEPYQWSLTKLALNDDAMIADMTESDEKNLEASGLDPRSHALVRIGALLALGASPASYGSVVRLAERAGVSPREIAGVLVAVAPHIGIARTVYAAPELALALGFDVDDLIERRLDRPGRDRDRTDEGASRGIGA